MRRLQRTVLVFACAAIPYLLGLVCWEHWSSGNGGDVLRDSALSRVHGLNPDFAFDKTFDLRQLQSRRRRSRRLAVF